MAFFGLFGKGGKRFGGDLVGRNIKIEGKRIIVDGKLITDDADGVVELRIIGADSKIDSVDASCNVTISGDLIGDIDAGMDVRCGDVTGNVEAGMSVTCNNVGGDAESGMGLDCGSIGGDAEAGMNVECHGDIMGKAKAGLSINAKTVTR